MADAPEAVVQRPQDSEKYVSERSIYTPGAKSPSAFQRPGYIHNSFEVSAPTVGYGAGQVSMPTTAAMSPFVTRPTAIRNTTFDSQAAPGAPAQTPPARSGPSGPGLTEDWTPWHTSFWDCCKPMNMCTQLLVQSFPALLSMWVVEEVVESDQTKKAETVDFRPRIYGARISVRTVRFIGWEQGSPSSFGATALKYLSNETTDYFLLLGCMVTWCPCIIAGRSHARFKNPTLKNVSDCNGYCCGWAALCSFGIMAMPLQWIMGMMTRREMRIRYGLGGSGCGDCMRTACCCWCALVQQEKEFEFRNAPHTAMPQTQGYFQAPTEMVYSRQ